MTEDEMAGWHHRLDGHEFAMGISWSPLCALKGVKPPVVYQPITPESRPSSWLQLTTTNTERASGGPWLDLLSFFTLPWA